VDVGFSKNQVRRGWWMGTTKIAILGLIVGTVGSFDGRRINSGR